MHHDMSHMMMPPDASPGPLQWLLAWLSGNGYAPHSGCFLGDTQWVGAYVAGNWVIALAYALVALLIAQRMQRASHIPKTVMGNALLGIFITCSVGHFLAGVTTIAWPGYRLETLWHWLTTIPAWLFLAHHKKFSLIVEGPHMIAESREELSQKNSELNALYEQVKQVDRLKSEFFANVSHELRTPLALILGPLSTVLGGENLTPDQRRDLEVAQRNARTVLKHVNDLLDIARMEADKMSMHYADVDLAQLTRLTASHFDSVVGERGLTLTLDTPPALPAQIDSDKIQRVLLNLLSNAIKFTPPGGAVLCRLSHQSGAAILQVQDNGPGIPADMREAVFERFRQVDSAATRRHEGTGLGLAIVKEFITLHGGTITAGEAPGGGALFTVLLPLVAPAGVTVANDTPSADAGSPRDRDANETAQGFVDEGVGQSDRFERGGSANGTEAGNGAGGTAARTKNGTSPAPSRSTTNSLSAGNLDAVMMQTLEELRASEQSEIETQQTGQPLVLIVEDNLEMSRFIARTLAPQYRTAIARDGEQGLMRALALRPDLILSDVMMPIKSGDQMVRDIRNHAELDATPIVMLTAKEDEALRVHMLSAGAQDYLAKPFTSEELHARIDNLIATKRARQLLQAELASRQQNLEELAGETIARKHALQAALIEAGTARRIAEEAREEALLLQREVATRNALLSAAILEAHHRIKNNLQIVSALMEMQVDGRDDALPLSIARAYLRQVKCIALVHNLLTQETDYTFVDAVAVLQSVADLAVVAQSGQSRTLLIRFQAVALHVHVKIAVALALILNELLVYDVTEVEAQVTPLLQTKAAHTKDAQSDGSSEWSSESSLAPSSSKQSDDPRPPGLPQRDSLHPDTQQNAPGTNESGTVPGQPTAPGSFQQLLQEGVSSNVIIISLRREGSEVLLSVENARWRFAPDFDVFRSGMLGLELIAALVESDLQGRLRFGSGPLPAPDASDDPDRLGRVSEHSGPMGGHVEIVFPERPDAA